MLGTGKRVAFWRGIYIGQRNEGAAIGQHTYRFNQGRVSVKAGALAHLRPGERAAVTEYITHIRQRFPRPGSKDWEFNNFFKKCRRNISLIQSANE